jgi:hypothetical protein
MRPEDRPGPPAHDVDGLLDFDPTGQSTAEVVDLDGLPPPVSALDPMGQIAHLGHMASSAKRQGRLTPLLAIFVLAAVWIGTPGIIYLLAARWLGDTAAAVAAAATLAVLVVGAIRGVRRPRG